MDLKHQVKSGHVIPAWHLYASYMSGLPSNSQTFIAAPLRVGLCFYSLVVSESNGVRPDGLKPINSFVMCVDSVNGKLGSSGDAQVTSIPHFSSSLLNTEEPKAPAIVTTKVRGMIAAEDRFGNIISKNQE